MMSASVKGMRCLFIFLIAQCRAQHLKSLISLSQILDRKPSIIHNGHINIIQNASSTDVDEVMADTGGNTIQLCYLPYLLRFSANGEPENSVGSYEGLAAVSLALEHLNTGNGVISPNITNINQRCPLRFYSDSFDTMTKPSEGLARLINLTDPDTQQLVPCAILGAASSSVSIATAVYSSLRDFVQISPLSTSRTLDDQEQFPLFGRTIPSDEGTAIAFLGLMKNWNVNHIAIIHINNAYGNDFVQTIESLIPSINPTLEIKIVSFDNEVDDGGISRAVKLLKDSKFRYFFAVITNNTILKEVMLDAHKQGIAGTGQHTWIFSVAMDSIITGRSFPLDSPLGQAYKGTGVLGATGGVVGMEGVDGLTLAMQELRNDDDLSFLNAHLPRYAEGGSVNHSEVTSQATFLSDTGYAAPFLYDAVIALGLAACSLTSKPENFTGQDLYQAFVETEFEGASGSVKFINTTGSRTTESTFFSLSNFVVDNDSDGKVTFKKVESILSISNQSEIDAAYIFANGTSIIPPDLPAPEYDPNYIHTLLKVFGLLLCTIIMTMSIAFCLWTYRNRKVQVVVKSQPIFLYIISLGTLLMGSAIIPLTIDDGWLSQGADAACMATPWLISIGWSLTFSALFTKTWRIRRILQSAAKFKRIKLTASDVMKPMIALLLANIIVLTVWTIVDPLEVKTETVAIDEFDRPIESKSFCRSEHQTIYLSILVVINLGSLAFSLIQAFQARKISTEFNESSYIFVAMWTILYACLLGIPVLIIANQNVQACYFVSIGLLFIICNSILLLIFLPKVVASRKKKDTRTPIINQFTIPVLGQSSRSGIGIVSFGKSALEQENLQLKNLVESLTRRLEQSHETVRNDEVPASIEEVGEQHPISNLGHGDVVDSERIPDKEGCRQNIEMWDTIQEDRR